MSLSAALRLIESRRARVEKLHTHEFPLAEAARAVRTLAGESGAGAISVTIEPGL